MKLGLSSAAATDLGLPELLEGCRNRGLASLELVGGGAHDVGAALTPAAAEAVLRLAARASVTLAALQIRAIDEEPLADAMRAAALLGVPLLFSLPRERWSDLTAIARQSMGAGCRILLLHHSDPDFVEGLVDALGDVPTERIGLAWEVDPRGDDPAAWAAVLESAGSRLAYVRLRGGGPESLEQTGMGVGSLMARLTLAGYRGDLVLTPGEARYHRAWLHWLTRGGGWGCGSKQADPSLVQIPSAS